MLPFLISKKVRKIILKGSENANNICGAIQIFKEFGFEVHAFLKKGYGKDLGGNAMLNQLLLAESEVTWFRPRDVKGIDQEIDRYLSKQKCSDDEILILPEGSSHTGSLPGAMSLALDIQKNEEQLGITFSTIFVDAGTGFAAQALILGLGILEHPAKICVIDIGGCEENFFQRLDDWGEVLKGWGFSGTVAKEKVRIFKPESSKSFGSVSRQDLDFIHQLAKKSGILCDPIYSAKCLSMVKSLATHFSPPHLAIHSGGQTSLFGFTSKLLS